MQTFSTKVHKVQVTLHITKEAQDTMLDNGYCGVRGMGAFLSQLVMDYHARVSRKPTQAEIATELHTLASLLEEVEQVAPTLDTPMPLAKIEDTPSGVVGAIVISEEPGRE